VHQVAALSIRTFIFCDRCNRDCTRTVDYRRRSNRSAGRRILDDRAWFSGSVEEAVEEGWAVAPDGLHYCKRCAAKLAH
jgi:hypothetical protein